MTAQRNWFSPAIFILCMTALSWATVAWPADAEDTIILVAKPQWQDAVYGASVLVAKSLPDGSSIGLILNKPTSTTLGMLFPDDKPSLDVPGPVFLGGVENTNVIFALVERHDTPGTGSLEIASGIFLAVDGQVVDGIIASESDHARFFAGIVVWRPGELTAEIKRGLWYEIEPDPALVFRKETNGMWEELVYRSEISKLAI